ncbi:MAG: tRNA (adenosine(37)-N6)-threonylcarbamoyltransferase complex transferase subunit TsaD [Proteobacteria bacterium]|nr:tRNA (adenosine(37)-N6)-threonylcarbamoyltransferase complex transferase subunit TsaD [Pseudomonadota bacterium]
MIILGIETSCDETAAALVENGKTILSSVVSSQIEDHHAYGGVVPEIAARKHLEAIVPVVQSAMDQANIPTQDIDALAVTQGPGLVGALLVGFSFAKAFAYARKIPWVGVNHLEGHITSVFLNEKTPEFPYVALLVSGGHTSIYHICSHTECELMGQTRDDAVGEAYDKVSKMLDLGYPGGLIIDNLAKKGDASKIPFPRAWLDKSAYDFSFSGVKSAVRRYIEDTPDYKNRLSDIAAGFQESVVEVLTYKLIHAAKEKGCRDISVVGGVAANSRLREAITNEALKHGLRVHVPSIDLCGDNAAMIAAAAFHLLQNGQKSGMEDDVFSRAKSPMGQKHR